MNIKIISVLLLSGLLVSCAGVVVVGAAGSMMVYDRRSLPTIEKDSRIFYVINNAIAKNRGFYHSHVSITSHNQIVLLTGEVTSEDLKIQAEKIAQGTPNVQRVYNELTINEPISIRQRSKDTLMTGEIRSKMLAKEGLASGSIRIITENANVFLMGTVSREQSNLAVNVARQVEGVKKVVKIFQYK